MLKGALITFAAACVGTALLFGGSASAQAPQFDTRKVAENVDLFRYGGHQAMFASRPTA